LAIFPLHSLVTLAALSVKSRPALLSTGGLFKSRTALGRHVRAVQGVPMTSFTA
jgi:hypothetical protein